MKIRNLITSFIMLVFVSTLWAQGFQETGKLEWVVKDREFSRSFMEAYIDTLMEIDDMAELEVQETDELRVIVGIDVEGHATLESIYAKGRSGVLNKLVTAVLDSMDVEMVQRIQSRKYNWDYLAAVDVGGGRGDVINVFEERSNKQVRDAFWWTHRRVDISVFPRMFIRVNPNFAFATEFGRQDLGFPAAASRTLNMGLATEVLKFYVTLPASYLNLMKSSNSPLEGTFGGVLKFDSPNFGGSLSFQDMNFLGNTDTTGFLNPSNVVYNPSSGQFYYSFTSRIGTTADQPGFVPLGSLRLQIGFSYMQFAYGDVLDTEAGVSDGIGSFRLLDKSDPLESVFGLFRAEYASDMNNRYFNRFKLAAQLNIGLNGFGGFDFTTAYTITEWLGVNLNMTYFWSPMTFNYPDPTPGSTETLSYDWEPGFFIVPSIAVYF
ncbi:MAG: hypothetical protein HQ506_02365 [Candidatus Marinimicrobia bacterium]|nr:hypothetical protein [Candidatus Neomarinimicrobiota bacterium]